MNNQTMKPLLHAYVFHLTKWTPLATETDAAKFSCVAMVIAHDTVNSMLETTFTATNNCETPWTQTLGHFPHPVGSLYANQARSTSVGDLILIGRTLYRCALDGWEQLSDANIAAFIARIPTPTDQIEAHIQAINQRYETQLSFGCSGNVWSGSSDDRCWSVWANEFSDAQGHTARWGQFDTKNLPTMAQRAAETLEAWVAHLKAGRRTEAGQLSWATH